MPTTGKPITVALVNDYEIIVHGLAAMLAPFSDRVTIVEIQVGDQPERYADVALFDTFAGRRHAIGRAREMVHDGYVDHVLLYTWDAAAEFLTLADDAGVSGVALKSQTGEAWWRSSSAWLRANASVSRTSIAVAKRGITKRCRSREQEVLALIACGMSNAEIGQGVVPLGRHGEDLRPPAVRQVGRQESGAGCVARSETQCHAAGNAAWPG